MGGTVSVCLWKASDKMMDLHPLAMLKQTSLLQLYCFAYSDFLAGFNPAGPLTQVIVQPGVIVLYLDPDPDVVSSHLVLLILRSCKHSLCFGRINSVRTCLLQLHFPVFYRSIHMLKFNLCH